MANFVMNTISPQNDPSRTVKNTINGRISVRVTDESKGFILDDIDCQEYLEYSTDILYNINEYPDEENEQVAGDDDDDDDKSDYGNYFKGQWL